MFNEGQSIRMSFKEVCPCACAHERLPLYNSLLLPWSLTSLQAHKGAYMPRKISRPDFICSEESRGTATACKMWVMWPSEVADLTLQPPNKATLCLQLAFKDNASDVLFSPPKKNLLKAQNECVSGSFSIFQLLYPVFCIPPQATFFFFSHWRFKSWKLVANIDSPKREQI